MAKLLMIVQHKNVISFISYFDNDNKMSLIGVHGLQAELLMTVHHKKLVSFVGYCDDDNKMALIYEHMTNGSLKDFLFLSGTTHTLLHIQFN